MKCQDNNYVRCCGASSSFVIGKIPTTTEFTIPTTTSTSEEANESSMVETTTTSISNSPEDRQITEDNIIDSIPELFTSPETEITTTATTTSDSESLTTVDMNSSSKILNNEEEETGQSSVDYITEGTTEYATETTLPTDSAINNIDIQRRPKLINNVMMVYPHEMSGIPKTTPKNMPEEKNEMDEFDEDMGMNVHVVYSSNALPETDTTTENVPTTTNVNKEVVTTELPSTENLVPETETQTPIDLTSTELAAARSELHTQHLKSTNKNDTTLNDKEIKRIKYSQHRRRIFERTSPSSGISTTVAPSKIKTRLRELYKTHLNENNESTEKKVQVETSTRTIFKTRKQLFNAHNRLNYLRKKSETTTAATETDAPTTTTQVPTTERPTSIPKEAQILKETVENEHRLRIKSLRKTLLMVMNRNNPKEVPRAISNPVLNNRVSDVEHLLRRRVNNAVKEINVKPEIVLEKQGQEEETTTTTTKRPYRGHRRFNTSSLNEIVTIPRRRLPVDIDITTSTTVPTPITTKPEEGIPSFNRLFQNRRLTTPRSNISSYVHRNGRQYKKVKIVSRAVTTNKPSTDSASISDLTEHPLIQNVPEQSKSVIQYANTPLITNREPLASRKMDTLDSTVETADTTEIETQPEENPSEKQLSDDEFIFVNDFMEILTKVLQDQENEPNQTALSAEAILDEISRKEGKEVLVSNISNSDNLNESDDPEIVQLIIIANDTDIPTLNNYTDENFELISPEIIQDYFKTLLEKAIDGNSENKEKQTEVGAIRRRSDDDPHFINKDEPIPSGDTDNDEDEIIEKSASAFIPSFRPAPEWVKSVDKKYISSNHFLPLNRNDKTYYKPYKPANYDDTVQQQTDSVKVSGGREILAPSSLYGSTYGIENPHKFDIIGPIPKPLFKKERKLSFGLPYSGSRFR